MRERHFRIGLMALYIFGVFLLSLPHIRGVLDSRFQGLMPDRGSDENHYLVRLQEGLIHPLSDTSNGIFGGPSGVQPAGLEQFVGLLFLWTGASAPAIAVIVSVALAPLVIVFVALTLRLFSVGPVLSLFSGFLYFFLFLGPLRRTVHQSWSLPITLFAFALLVSWWQQPDRRRAIFAGALLGLLPHIYFWSWTFLWTLFALLVAIGFVQEKERFLERYRTAFLLGGLAIIVALPAFVRMILISQHPLMKEVALRSSVVFVRELESPLRSGAFLLLTFFAIFSLVKLKKSWQTLPLLSGVIALLLVLHQQFVHGAVISFWTHYYPYVGLVCLLTVVVLISQKDKNPVGQKRFCPTGLVALFVNALSAALASIFLLAAFFDYHGRLSLFAAPRPEAFQYQRLLPALKNLSNAKVETILTDRSTALQVAANTEDDVVFTEHVRHVLVPTRELAERYCLSEALSREPIDRTYVPNMLHELSRAGREEDARLMLENARITNEACDWVSTHVQEAMEKYHADFILWNETLRPDWEIPRSLGATQVSRGEGWSLWRYTK